MKTTPFVLFAVVLLAGCGPDSTEDRRADTEEDWTAPLHEALRGATRLRVRSGGTCHRVPDEEKTLLDLRDADEIAEVVQRIRIDPNGSGFHCMCCGNPTLEFYHNDTLTLSLGFHHGRSLRWLGGTWEGDGLLTKDSADFLIQWLAEHGVQGPQEEREESLRLRKKSEASQERWLKAMPSSLRPFWNNMGDPFAPKRTQDMDAALAKQFPNQSERILALLQWFGSGEGPWSGFPSYESVAEELLLLYETEAILEAIRDAELTDQQIEGAARLFGGWDFSRRRPNDLDLVPDDLKQRLLEHSLKSDNEDKRGRAERAFGERGAETGRTKQPAATE